VTGRGKAAQVSHEAHQRGGHDQPDAGKLQQPLHGLAALPEELQRPWFKCGAYHPRRYLNRALPPPLTLVEVIPEGARGNPHQDQVVLRKLQPASRSMPGVEAGWP
jgi:hypothetical protein